MLIHIPRHGFDHATPSDITPREIFERRRELLRAGAAGDRSMLTSTVEAIVAEEKSRSGRKN